MVAGSRLRNLFIAVGVGLVIACSPATPAATTGSSAPSASGATSSPLTPISVRILLIQPHFDGNLPTLVAMDEGFFTKNGLNVTLVTASGNPMIPLLGGQADIAADSGTLPALSAVAQGQDVKAFATVVPKFTETVLVKKGSPLAQNAGQYPAAIQALKGKTIGVSTAGALVDLSMRYLLIQAGLTPDTDVKIVPLGGGTPELSGLETGAVDAINSYEPFTSQAQARGTAVSILDFAKDKMPDAMNQPYIIAVAKGQYIKDNPEVIKRYRAALSDTFKFMSDKGNRDEVVKVATKYIEGLDAPVIAGVVDRLILIGFRIDYTTDDLTRGVNLMKAVGILKTDISPDTFIAK